MPLGHVNAICGAMTYCIIKGVDFVHSDFTSIVYFDKLMKLERPDLLNCSPFFLESIIKLDRISPALDNLPAQIVCASAPLKEETFVTISSFGSNVRPAYGLSEAVNFSIGFGVNDKNSTNAIFQKFKYLPTGRALEGNTVKIIDERANELAEGEVGNIAVSGEIVFDGYLNSGIDLPFLISPQGQRLLLTGDKGYKRVLNGCAYIKITGRNKETINFRGLQYYFTDLENTIRPLVNLDFYISDAHIFDVTLNRDTSIFIALESSPQLKKFVQNNGDLQTTISKLIGNIPFSIVEIAKIPRTQSGKIKRLERVDYVRKLFE
jgi:acyl-CoA synthetase (AMP-forming)/AMP-acid ligase II